jgi:hypothetical protein
VGHSFSYDIKDWREAPYHSRCLSREVFFPHSSQQMPAREENRGAHDRRTEALTSRINHPVRAIFYIELTSTRFADEYRCGNLLWYFLSGKAYADWQADALSGRSPGRSIGRVSGGLHDVVHCGSLHFECFAQRSEHSTVSLPSAPKRFSEPAVPASVHFCDARFASTGAHCWVGRFDACCIRCPFVG